MTTFKIAHIREQGQDMIIMPLDDSFQYKSNTEQNAVRNSLQLNARSARLAGTVVLVWNAGSGRMAFLAPRPWHPFFSSLTLADVARSINRTLTCN